MPRVTGRIHFRTVAYTGHSETFRDIQLWDGLEDCAMTATFSAISETFSATSETFSDTAPVGDGLTAERAERGMGKS